MRTVSRKKERKGKALKESVEPHFPPSGFLYLWDTKTHDSSFSHSAHHPSTQHSLGAHDLQVQSPALGIQQRQGEYGPQLTALGTGKTAVKLAVTTK